jgi:hypothetical protein
MGVRMNEKLGHGRRGARGARKLPKQIRRLQFNENEKRNNRTENRQ